MPEPPNPSPLASTFSKLSRSGRRAFIPYITAGDPAPERTVEIMEALVGAGADILELGVPFSDPLADGPTIQAATHRALGRGVGIEEVLRWTEDFCRRRDAPVVLFSYLNPIVRYGPERFVRDAEASGAAGLLITDLPLGADRELEAVLTAGAMDVVRLVAPTTSESRLDGILAAAQGFIYYISRTGVTGERKDLRRELAEEVGRLRTRTELPIAVGFGISNPEQARSVAGVADGVVVGSVLVRALWERGLEEAIELAREIRGAIDTTI